ncbi:serpentine type 7TM GPCR chemoreceptor srv domain-containing protein [Ditylenchus destructor]|uniref:Serpentine type 7TM GPCR chemoreceptor srv domain-containing protein n=1 Tax=Ditylenchus destructor TaxID=166010 RepID=A0AAD4MMV3_9BILA|nr:serpentine type 7TM GPCR chemoreceptor srv domain-containing protein [Ditylenchus destructor]
MVCAGHIFLSVIDIPATMFHISMAVFLFYNIFKKSKHFCTGFYVLFATISLFDVIQICMIYITLRIPSCGYFYSFYFNNQWLVWLMYISTTYIEFYQLFGHTLISANRFAVLALQSKYNMVGFSRFNQCDIENASFHPGMYHLIIPCLAKPDPRFDRRAFPCWGRRLENVIRGARKVLNH